MQQKTKNSQGEIMLDENIVNRELFQLIGGQMHMISREQSRVTLALSAFPSLIKRSTESPLTPSQGD